MGPQAGTPKATLKPRFSVFVGFIASLPWVGQVNFPAPEHGPMPEPLPLI
jgi:hypothetical protein